MFVKIVMILLVVAFAVGFMTRTSHGAGREQIYLVRPSDTLWSIAAHHYAGDPREGIWKLERRNHLTGPALLRPGQRLVLPAP
ncbi:MAG: LysM peptidoglycan-binding domain-containing protein [Gaiellaceae bacterium]